MGVRGRQEQGHLKRHDGKVDSLDGISVDEQADRDLREGRDDVDAREQHTQQRGIFDDAGKAFSQELAVAVGREVEEQARGDRRRRHDREDARERRPARRCG